jgi:hypothetical protein
MQANSKADTRHHGGEDGGERQRKGGDKTPLGTGGVAGGTQGGTLDGGDGALTITLAVRPGRCRWELRGAGSAE